jgi:hypothetical protein
VVYLVGATLLVLAGVYFVRRDMIAPAARTPADIPLH